MLILKQNAANTVPTPPAGKGTIFLDDSDVLSVKTSSGDVENFPTVAASNSQVVFMNGSALSGEAALTYDFNNNVLTVNGNVAAGNVKTDNLLYANGTPWDLSDPGGSNTQVQFNDDESFGGSAAFTFNKTSNLVSMGGALSVTGNANVNNLGTAQVLASANVTAPQFISNISTGSAPLVVTSTTRVANLDVEKAGVANTVNDAAQPNITSVGTLTSLSVSGNANVGNLGTAGLITATGNVSGGNLTTVGALSVTGNANVGNIGAVAGVFTGNIISINANLGNLANANYFTGDGSNLTNVIAQQIFVNNGNVSSNSVYYPLFTSVTGNADVDLDNFGNTIEYTPATATLSFGQANVDVITNGGLEIIDLDGNNNKIRFSVTGTANTLVLANTVVTSAVPLQLATYASNGARDAAVTSPVAGMMIFVTGSGMQVRGATQWNLVAGTGT